MSGTPLVSILTATRNNLEGLKRTVDSVAAQEFSDYEHIVVDGGSTDGTREWLEERGASLRWLSEPDNGIADALNKGVAMARGKWILVLQAEDTFRDDGSLAAAVSRLGDGVDVICFDVEFVTASSRRRLRSRGFSPRLNFKPFPHQGAFTRRRLFDRVGMFDTGFRLHMDYDFYLRAYRRGASSKVIGEVLSAMPDTGVTSRLDWPSLRARFAEERLIHGRHQDSRWLKLVYTVLWPPYLLYRRIGAMTAGMRCREDHAARPSVR